MPYWWKTLVKASNNVRMFTDNRASTMLSTNISSKTSYTMWHGLSTTDIQSSIDFGVSGYQVAGSATVGSLAQARLYMYGHRASHVWKNNSNTVAVMEFYILLPRRDLPVYLGRNGGVGVGYQVISPPNSYNYGDCVRQDPNMYTAPFGQMGNASSYIAATKISANDIDATPYMNSWMASFFKIKRLRVNGPSGHSARQTIQPGQEASLLVNHPKPRLVNYAKYGLTGAGDAGGVTTDYTVANTYEVLRETPLIFCYIRGGVGHDKDNPLNVATTKAWVDYICKRHWEVRIVQSGGKTSQSLVQQTTFTGAAEETNAFGGAQVVQEADV